MKRIIPAQNVKLTEDQQHNILVWLVAIRSGDFEQGRGWLKATTGDDGVLRHCCLGVACELNSIPNRHEDKTYGFIFDDEGTYSHYPKPNWFKEKYGFMYDVRLWPGGYSIACMNDHPLPFSVIADVIETAILNNKQIEIEL